MRFKFSLRAIASILATVAFALTTPAFAQPANTIKIGFASPLSGPQAHYGKDNQNGAQLAIDELNARNLSIAGKPARFELVSADDQADPRTGAIVAQQLVDARIRGVVGHFNSSVTIPASRIYHDAGIPQLSVSTNVKYTRQGYKTAFRVMADDDRQGAALGEHAVRHLKLSRFAVVDDQSAYGQGLADAFTATVKKSGGAILRREHVTDKDVEFRSLITLLKSSQPQAVFFGGYDAQAGPMARQMKELGLNVPLLGGETLNTAKFLQLAGHAAEGHIASTPGAALEKRPGGKAFAERYRQRHRQEIGLYAPYFYDSVMMIAAAMQKADSSEPSVYVSALRAMRHAGVTADIEFDGNGDIKQGLLSIFRVQNSQWVLQ